jgi:hypothetical protein
MALARFQQLASRLEQIEVIAKRLDDQKLMTLDNKNAGAQSQSVPAQFPFTAGVWEDPDSWPDTVDDERPNAVSFPGASRSGWFIRSLINLPQI